MLSKKIIFRVLINTAVGIILVFVWLQFVNLDEIINILSRIDIRFGILFFGFFILSTIFRSLRLKLLLHQFKPPLINLICLNFVSQLLSFLIPLRVGELAKGIYLSSQYSLPFGKTLVWILIDRFLDFWVNLLLIGMLVLIMGTALGVQFEIILFSILAIFTAVTIFMIKSANFSSKMLKIGSELLIFPKIKITFLKVASTIVEGFAILRRNPYELLLLLLVSVGAAISDSLIWFFIFYSLGVNIGIFKTLFGSLLSALTFLIPAAPGYIGSAEASGLAVFGGALGIDSNIASAGVVLNHIVAAISLLSFGLLSIYLLKFNLKSVWQKILKKET